MNHMENKIITLNGKEFEYAIQGNNSPSIIFINGAGGPIDSWFIVWGDLSLDNISFVYNRLGIGKSSQPTEPQSGSVMVRDLKDLLINLGIKPPYILVGHSLGGFIAHLFTLTHPNEVAGVVFLESATIQDVLSQTNKNIKKKTAPFSEMNHVLTTINEIKDAGVFPDIPVVVIAGNKPAFSWLIPRKVKQARLEHQKELVNLSKHGLFIIAEKSGHFPQFSESQLVVDAINELLQQIKKS